MSVFAWLGLAASGNELLFGVHHVYGTGIAFTPATGWSLVDTQSRYDEIEVQDQVVASPGSYSSTGVESSSNDTLSVVVAFRGASR